MTEEELRQARELRTRWDGAWEVDGRPITNVEMVRLIEWKKDERRKAEEFLRSEL